MYLLLAVVLVAACGHDSAKLDPPNAAPESKPLVELDQKLDRWDGGGAPITGGLAIHGRLGSATNQLSKATGTILVSCDACTFGDGGKVVPPKSNNPKTAAFAGDGIAIPPIALGAISGTATFTDGAGVIDGHLGSPDLLELTAKGTIKLADNYEDSDLDVHLAFRAGKSLDPKAQTIVATTGASMDNDGWYKIHVTGKVSAPKRLAEP
jgi:type II secretion system protein N